MNSIAFVKKQVMRHIYNAMSHIHKWAKKLKKNWFIFFVILAYIFFVVYYMGPAFTDCSNTIHGLGDSTAGPVWRESLKPNQPLLGGYESATNYPAGESLYSPVGFVSLAETTALSLASRVVGPVCSYDMSNVMGYLTTSMIMFAFIFYLTKSRWIGFLAGYAVAFTPYVQSKIGGHPSYAYGSLLIAIIWLGLHTIKTRKVLFAVLLATAMGVCAYFDPYFILLSGTILGPMLGVWALYALVRSRREAEYRATAWSTVKVLLVGIGVLMVLLAPLAYISIKDAHTISSTVGNSRGNVFQAAMLCSNTPLDYLLPDPYNTHLVDIFGQKFIAKDISFRHWCGPGESRVSISLTMLGVILLGAIIIAWERINGRRANLRRLYAYDSKLLLLMIVVVGLAALLVGLPPHVGGLRMSSDLVLKITSTWRIFAREYMVVNIAVVILFAILLKYFGSIRFAKEHKLIAAALFIGLFLLILGEYQITTPFNPLVFSYSRDVPAVYHQIKNDKDIKVIAEYPIDRLGIEYDSIVYYLTMQTYHGKSLFNSALASDYKGDVHVALKDLTDPQTLPALRYLGIKYVVIHGLTVSQIMAHTNQLDILGDSKPPIFSLQILRPESTNDVVLAKIVDGPKTSNVLTFERGFAENLNIMQSPMDTEFETLQDAELKVTPLLDAPVKYDRECFGAKMSAPQDEGELTVSVNGVPQVTEHITGSAYTEFSVMAKTGDTLLLHNSKGYNVRLNNLGCSE